MIDSNQIYSFPHYHLVITCFRQSCWQHTLTWFHRGRIHHKHVCLRWGCYWPFHGVFHLVPASGPLLSHKVQCCYGQATLHHLRRYHTAPRQLCRILEVSLPHRIFFLFIALITDCCSQGYPYSLHTWIH